VLPRVHRLTSADGFRRAVRGGRRAGSRALVVHLALPSPRLDPDAVAGDDPALSLPPTVGFVVSKAVGNAVTRNRVKRRLRHLAADRLGSLPAGSTLVVRALPPAAEASYADLGDDLDRTLERLAWSGR
jgi:ribonuclease P protein component